MPYKRSIFPVDYLRKLDEVLNAKFDFGHTYISCFTELRDSLSQWRAMDMMAMEFV
jgi:hypothetical protein